MSKTANNGRFVWYEQLAKDPEKAIDFYTSVVGWKTQPFNEGEDEDYVMWVGEQGPLGGVMRLLTLPRGLTYSAPSDRLGATIADLVSNPTESRERLGSYLYSTIEPSNPLGMLQEALVLSQTAEPIEKRIRVEGVKTGKVTALDLPGQITQALAAGIISETEAASLREYDRKVMDIVNVDDFAPNELGVQAQPAPQAPAAVTSFHVA